MKDLLEIDVACPYCGEMIEVLIDPQEMGQTYIEDCQVCCKPIIFDITEDASGDVAVSVQSEDEPYF
jgi:hypothetical protein